MKIVGFRELLPATDPNALLDLEASDPVASGHDILVRVKAVSVNPVDTKVRTRAQPAPGEVRVLGFDAAGVVEAVGEAVTLFSPGDEVFYAGAIGRPGSNAELQLVDERIVGRKPKSLDFAQAAAMPLTFITAWELLFDRFGVARDGGEGQTLVIIGGAGGVGSALIQLARRLTRLNVVASASRDETRRWVEDLGAHQIFDHTKPLVEELARLGLEAPAYIACLTHSAQHFPQVSEAIALQGKIGIIEADGDLNIRPLQQKAASIHWEYMFARPQGTPDMIEQHRLLNQVADLVDQGVLRTTLTQVVGKIRAADLLEAHRIVESARTIGKVALEGF